MGHSEEASLRRLYKSYQYECRRKNHYWGLTLEEFREITQMPCAYCGRAPSSRSRSYVFNGIDRVNSGRGYEVGNCVSSCTECNMIKGNRLSFEEMVAVAKALREHRGKGTVPANKEKSSEARREKQGKEKAPRPKES